jgi:hypothetical protein
MESFIDEIKAVVKKYKAIASARITAFISSIKVAWANLIKKPAPQSKEKVEKNG